MSSEGFDAVRIGAGNARKQAKDTRRKWKNQPSPQRDLDFEAALRNLDEAIERLTPFASEGSAYRKDAEREIGDCYGVQGGTYRDWGKYGEAADAYDRGLPFERSGQPNSYCLVQRLVSRILEDPVAFQRAAPIRGVDVTAELKASVEEIQRQKKVLRKGDPWAQADLALVLQLLSSEGAEIEWDNLDDMKPDHGVYESTLEVVRLIRKKLPFDAWMDVENRLAFA